MRPICPRAKISSNSLLLGGFLAAGMGINFLAPAKVLILFGKDFRQPYRFLLPILLSVPSTRLRIFPRWRQIRSNESVAAM